MAELQEVLRHRCVLLVGPLFCLRGLNTSDVKLHYLLNERAPSKNLSGTNMSPTGRAPRAQQRPRPRVPSEALLNPNVREYISTPRHY